MQIGVTRMETLAWARKPVKIILNLTCGIVVFAKRPMYIFVAHMTFVWHSMWFSPVISSGGPK
jgi:hypothetical protein